MQGREMLGLLSVAGAEGEQTWLGPGFQPFPHCRLRAGMEEWNQARQTLFIHFLACSELTGP